MAEGPIKHVSFFPESIAKGSSGKSFRHLHLDTHTWITCTRILTLGYLHLHRFVTYTWILTLGYIRHLQLDTHSLIICTRSESHRRLRL